jgi:hypothetical protein
MVLIFALFALLAGCIHEAPPPARLAQAAPVASVLLVDREEGADALPSDVQERIEQELSQRNLEARVLDAGALGGTRNTQQRLAQLAHAPGNAPWLLLLETRVVYYDLLQGRFRWIVYGRATVARHDDLATAASAEFEVPVFLSFEHEREPEALRAAARVMADRTGALLDNVLAGRP